MTFSAQYDAVCIQIPLVCDLVHSWLYVIVRVLSLKSYPTSQGASKTDHQKINASGPSKLASKWMCNVPTKRGMIIVLKDGWHEVLNIKGLCLKPPSFFRWKMKSFHLPLIFTTKEYVWRWSLSLISVWDGSNRLNEKNIRISRHHRMHWSRTMGIGSGANYSSRRDSFVLEESWILAPLPTNCVSCSICTSLADAQPTVLGIGPKQPFDTGGMLENGPY